MLKFVIVFFLLLAGCSDKELLGGLTQNEASQISIILGEYGVASQISEGNKSLYSLIVSSRQLHQARIVLNRLGLPKEKDSSFDELIKPSGLLPNSRKMEQLRLDHALAREFEGLLKDVGDISKAKAIVRINSVETGMNPSISILVEGIKLTPEFKDKIRLLVNKAFPNLTDSMKEIVFQEKEPYIISQQENSKINSNGEVLSYPLVPFFIWKVPVGVNNEMVIAVLLLTGFVFILGIFFGWFISKYRNLVKRDVNND